MLTSKEGAEVKKKQSKACRAVRMSCPGELKFFCGYEQALLPEESSGPYPAQWSGGATSSHFRY